MGGGGASPRHARGARTGGSAIAAFAAIAAAGGAAVVVQNFDLGTLAGLPLDEAIAAVVDQFCPPGILDEDTIRGAVAEALFEALGEVDIFDPAAVDDHVVVVATTCFVAELVFAAVTSEQGGAAEGVTPELAVRRENDLRDLIREVADQVAIPIIQRVGNALNPAAIEGVVAQITSAVYGEMARW